MYAIKIYSNILDGVFSRFSIRFLMLLLLVMAVSSLLLVGFYGHYQLGNMSSSMDLTAERSVQINNNIEEVKTGSIQAAAAASHR